MKKIFYKKVNKSNNKEMFEFLKNHDEYFTMNSWNGTTSIANNVKLYNLHLEGDWSKLLDYLNDTEYYEINDIIEMWNNENNSYYVGFNGRSGGYLVLYNNSNNSSVLDYYVDMSDNYNDFKDLLKDYGYTLQEYHETLKEQVKIVQSFDKLCDYLQEYCNKLSKEVE